ncbi:MAG: NAD(P)-binding protein [Candidatus Sumerlaeia bacterium]|nr:NAD(P)-binding protein [Candidatus Sumerlaeia bacterium]
MANQGEGKLKQRRAVVIGSGPGGLAAALALAARGARVHLLEERHDIAAEMMPMELEGFRFEPWPIFLNDPEPLVELFALNGHRISDFLTLRRADPLCQVWLDGETRIDWPADPEKFLGKMEALEGRPGRLRRYFKWGERLARASRSLHRAEPGWANHAKAFWCGRHWMPGMRFWNWNDAAAVSAMAGNNASLWRMINALGVLSGVPPRSGYGELARTFHAWTQNGGWFMEGGMEGLTRALLRLAEIKGIRIHRGTDLSRIVLQNGRVRRVEAAGLRPMSASIVVATQPLKRLLEACYPNPLENPEGKKPRVRATHHELPLFRWDVVCSKVPVDLPEVTLFPAPNCVEEMRFLHDWKLPAPKPSILIVRARASGGPDQKKDRLAFSIFVRVPPSSPRFRWSERVAAEYRQQIIGFLEEQGFGKWHENIHAEWIQHPPALGESTEPVRAASWTELMALPDNRTVEVPGLYLAGANCRPGGGLVGELLSGSLAAQRAENDAT